MWYAAAILVFSAIPPNMFTDYQTHFLPSPFATQADCVSFVAFKNAEVPTSALPVNMKAVWVCVQI